MVFGLAKRLLTNSSLACPPECALARGRLFPTHHVKVQRRIGDCRHPDRLPKQRELTLFHGPEVKIAGDPTDRQYQHDGMMHAVSYRFGFRWSLRHSATLAVTHR